MIMEKKNIPFITKFIQPDSYRINFEELLGASDTITETIHFMKIVCFYRKRARVHDHVHD